MKPLSRFTCMLATCMGVGLFLVTGCADDSPLGTDGRTTIGSHNVEQVQAEVDDQLTRAVFRGPGTYRGAHSGQLAVEPARAGKPVAAAGDAAVIKLRIAFEDFSEDGTLFLDGLVNYEPRGRRGARYQGTLTLSGRYEGKAVIDVSVAEDHRMRGNYKVGRNKVKVLLIDIPCHRGERGDLSDVSEAVRTTLRSMIAGAIAAGDGVHQGAQSGQVSVAVEHEDEEEGAFAEVEYRLVFENYSDDGEVFLDGELEIAHYTDGEQQFGFHAAGELRVSGRYEAELTVGRTFAGDLMEMVGKLKLYFRS